MYDDQHEFSSYYTEHTVMIKPGEMFAVNGNSLMNFNIDLILILTILLRTSYLILKQSIVMIKLLNY